MNYTFLQRFQVAPVNPERLSAQCGRIMDELVGMGVTDPLISGTMATGEVEISVVVDAESHYEAAGTALGLIRTAIHAAEGGTPAWPRLDESTMRAMVAERVDAEVPAGV